ncbi:hypothetical protein FLK61_30865 [Paenalkalicoccus suaedae]|uniref:CCA tRNA nucleotidyltransferase n=1 Tax=Paenalkalicoccus suaedae TaxID=2592382 RepID=A0A859FD20_9BACI|nr:hypothetical protein [Paenalkalicoccus suaedae]QKS71119.1 hypothetical protein FLK61_30865 [Paenalkalicoccus suaedae]
MKELFMIKSKVFTKLVETGYETYVVGGAVRDALLGKPSRDIDIACAISEDALRSVFTRVVAIGREKQSYLVFHQGERAEVTLMVDTPIEEDLKRRDFTVNAIAAAGSVLIDPFNGQRALKEKRLSQVTSQSFIHDPIRLLRAVRMEQQLDVTMDAKTFSSFVENRELLFTASKERIIQELLKLRNEIKHSSRVLELLETLGFAVSEEFAPQLIKIAQRSDTSFLAVLLTDKRRVSLLPKKLKQRVLLYHAYVERVPTSIDLLRLNREEVRDVSFLRELRGSKTNLLDQYDRLPIKDIGDLSVTGLDLIQAGVEQGPEIAHVKTQLLIRILNGKLNNEKETLLRFVKQEMIT